MIAFLNSQPIELTHETTVSELLILLNITDERGIAIAVNNTVIQKNSWKEFMIQNNDKITVIKATQGG